VDPSSGTDVFSRRESEVRSYCRAWPAVFDTAEGSRLTDVDGRRYLDFFAGAGSLNYGHNHPVLQEALISYLRGNGITHALDVHTRAKAEFLRAFEEIVLAPRGLDHKVQFPGPTGTNAVEAALKLARKATGRSTIVSFSSGFHGMTLGALAVSGNVAKRSAAGVALGNTHPVPYDEPGRSVEDALEPLARLLRDPGFGVELPAGVIVETVQGEGGINVARPEWLRGLSTLCRRYGMVLIVDDVQMGVGRTGAFFSFEESGIEPDIVCLAKSISGYGLPMSLVLMRRDLDVWSPGEHNGTFRGNSPAFVTATEALRTFWRDEELPSRVQSLGERVAGELGVLVDEFPAELATRGRGLARALATPSAAHADAVVRRCFEQGLLLETAGASGDVVKLLPPLTVSDDDLATGLGVLAGSVRAVMAGSAALAG